MNARLCLGVVFGLLLAMSTSLWASEAEKQAEGNQTKTNESDEPQPIKPTGVNVQNGTVQFGIVQYGPPQSGAVQYAPPGGQMTQFGGGGFEMGPMVAPPPAQPRMLRVRVSLFEVEPAAPAPKSSLASAEELLEMVGDEKLYELIDSFDLTTVTGHETKVQQGRRQPVVTSTQMTTQRGADGRATPYHMNNYTMQNVGTMLTVSPEMIGQRASLKLVFERSDLIYPDDGDDETEEADEEKVAPIANNDPPATSTMTIDTRVLLEDGQATILTTRDSRGVKHALVIAVEMLDSGEEARDAGGGGFF